MFRLDSDLAWNGAGRIRSTKSGPGDRLARFPKSDTFHKVVVILLFARKLTYANSRWVGVMHFVIVCVLPFQTRMLKCWQALAKCMWFKCRNNSFQHPRDSDGPCRSFPRSQKVGKKIHVLKCKAKLPSLQKHLKLLSWETPSPYIVPKELEKLIGQPSLPWRCRSGVSESISRNLWMRKTYPNGICVHAGDWSSHNVGKEV